MRWFLSRFEPGFTAWRLHANACRDSVFFRGRIFWQHDLDFFCVWCFIEGLESKCAKIVCVPAVNIHFFVLNLCGLFEGRDEWLAPLVLAQECCTL